MLPRLEEAADEPAAIGIVDHNFVRGGQPGPFVGALYHALDQRRDCSQHLGELAFALSGGCDGKAIAVRQNGSGKLPSFVQAAQFLLNGVCVNAGHHGWCVIHVYLRPILP